MFSSDRRTALVTGAGGGGIGRAVALALSARHHVLVNGLATHRETVAGLVEEIEAGGGSASAFLVDVAEPVAVRAALAVGRPVDVLVHNAAPSTPHQPIGSLSPDAWQADLDLILGAAFSLTQAVLPGMIARRWGRIVLISSSAAFRGTWGRGASYAAAKAGLHGLCAQLALELGMHGITANAIAPSQIDSPRVRRGGRRDTASLARYAAHVPVRRVGSPQDVAALVSYLASDEAGYMTGQVLRIDGGSSLATSLTQTLEK